MDITGASGNVIKNKTLHQTIIASDYDKQEKSLSLGGLMGIVHVKKDIGSHGLHLFYEKMLR